MNAPPWANQTSSLLLPALEKPSAIRITLPGKQILFLYHLFRHRPIGIVSTAQILHGPQLIICAEPGHVSYYIIEKTEWFGVLDASPGDQKAPASPL
jgi:hypothetical protein